MGDMSFGPYRLQRPLGRGGTGQVWLAHDTETERSVALKILAPELSWDAKYRQRFEREARAAAALRNPHVVPIHRFGELDDRLFIDMELIVGADVATLLACEGPMAPGVAVDLVTQTAAALDAAHRTGLVHRDVKPSNIVVDGDGFAYLIDFGTAYRSGQTAITGTGRVIGTLAYLAPERFTGGGDARCDVYALACVLYECLTARRPFGDTDPAQQLHAHLRTPPPRASDLNPAVPAALDQVIARGMAKEPDERYDSAVELARAAQDAVGTATPETTARLAAAVAPFIATGTPEHERLSWPGVITPETDVHVLGELSEPADTSPEPLHSAPHRREQLLAGTAIVLLAVAAGVVWSSNRLDSGAETDAGPATSESVFRAPAGSAPQSSSRSPVTVTPATTPVVATSAPVAQEPSSNAPSVPAIGQTCDPAHDRQVVSAQGITLSCIEIGGDIAMWSPMLAPVQQTNNPKPVENKPDDKPGHGNGHGNGKPKPDKDK
ncbi:serine/threonine-protein kinase [Nocardia goodfellowii]|uniref:non-specific serine/threonine protein kinase n=1 Tax=Nocardia goodfellowii TaxID=882446 RepID=A0ABS4Q676_9NOCA|nr:serine/threonine-protein kinase [Nocardia goodfellowii]MBP2187191.1 serine/threonine-protein kinase [Nocardia goodfellowii]